MLSNFWNKVLRAMLPWTDKMELTQRHMFFNLVWGMFSRRVFPLDRHQLYRMNCQNKWKDNRINLFHSVLSNVSAINKKNGDLDEVLRQRIKWPNDLFNDRLCGNILDYFHGFRVCFITFSFRKKYTFYEIVLSRKIILDQYLLQLTLKADVFHSK